jgi:hypothetical protein
MALDNELDAAEAAFDRLASEVRAGQDRMLAELNRLDCSETLGVIIQRLQAIEGHPALKVTPQQLARDLDAAREEARTQAEQRLYVAIRGIDEVAKDLKDRLAIARLRHRQDRLLVIAAVASFVAAIVLWTVRSGPVARSLPPRWAVPERMAAATLNLDGWSAGWRLLRWASPPGLELAAQGDRVALANRAALANREAAAKSSGKARRRVLTVPPNPDVQP